MSDKSYKLSDIFLFGVISFLISISKKKHKISDMVFNIKRIDQLKTLLKIQGSKFLIIFFPNNLHDC